MRCYFSSIHNEHQKYKALTFLIALSKRKRIRLLILIILALTSFFITRANAQSLSSAGFPAANILASAGPATIFVYPRFDCVNHDPATDTWTAYFGYTNLGSIPVIIPKGNNNEFIQDPASRNQPTTFASGTYYKVFSTDFDPSVGLNWVLNGVFTTVTTDSVVRCKDTPVTPSTTAFTYQGRLTDGGAAASGTYQMQFLLYDSLTNGSLQGSPNTVTNASVQVTSGVFTVALDFGMAGFNGADRFLEIAVKHSGDSSYTTLSPRQQVTPNPYALHANTADTLNGLTSDLFIQKTGDTLTGALSLPVNGLIVGATQLTASGGKVGIGTATPQSDLQVSGYLQIDVVSSSPPSTDCNGSSQSGRMKADATNDRLYVCTAHGWKSALLQ